MIYGRLVDMVTGEILAEKVAIDTLEDKKRKKKFADKKDADDKFKALQNEYIGKFVFFIYKNMNELCKILTDIELVRYIYLGTYVKNDGLLKLDNNKTLIDKKIMKKLLQIKDGKAFNKYYKKLVDNALLNEVEEELIINTDYFFRGSESSYRKITGKINFDDDFTRLYISTTRELYENSENKKRKQLHIIYKLLPYTSWKYNILCKNTKELDKDKIEPITLSEIIDWLGYDRTNLARFKKDFYNLRCSKGCIFKSVQGNDGYLKSMVILNPSICYKGDSVEQIERLIVLFK